MEYIKKGFVLGLGIILFVLAVACTRAYLRESERLLECVNMERNKEAVLEFVK